MESEIWSKPKLHQERQETAGQCTSTGAYNLRHRAQENSSKSFVRTTKISLSLIKPLETDRHSFGFSRAFSPFPSNRYGQ